MNSSFGDFLMEYRWLLIPLALSIGYLVKKALRNMTEERDAHFIINLVIGVLIAFVIYVNFRDAILTYLNSM